MYLSISGGHLPLRSTVFWSFIQSSCHMMVRSPSSSTTAQNFLRSTLFATSPLAQLTPSPSLWVPFFLSTVGYLPSAVHCHVCVCPSQGCTGGGCTLSPPSQAHTEESSPENVPAPLVTPLSPHTFNVSWTPPHTPNGERTSALLYMYIQPFIPD